MRLRQSWPSLLVLLVGLPFVVVEPGIVEAQDELRYHLPAIRGFAAELPFPDIRDYSASQAPFYHLVMAIPLRVGIEEVASLRLLSLVLSALGVAAVQWYFAGFTAPRRAAMFAAAIGLSPYYLGPAVFLATDNAAFGLMAIVLGLSVRASSPARPGLAAVVTTAAVLTRQLYAWLIPLCALYVFHRRLGPRALAWVALPAGALAALMWIWGGPVPPSFRYHQEPVGLLPLLAIVGTLGPWAVPLMPSLAATADKRRALILFAVLTVAAAGYLAGSPITDSHPAPWGGGMRTLGKYAGTIAGTSVIYWVTLPLGTLAVALLLARSASAHERVALIAFVLWAAAQGSNAAMLERYYQPFLLLMLFTFAAGAHDRRTNAGIAVVIGMIALTSVLRLVVHGYALFRF